MLQRNVLDTEEEDMIDLERIDRAYRAFIGREEKLMGSRILNAEIEGTPIFSPFEQARNSDGKFREVDINDFLNIVEEEEEKSEQTTKDQQTKNVDDLLVVT